MVAAGVPVRRPDHRQPHGIPRHGGADPDHEPTYELIKEEFVCQPRGVIEIKGKGALRTWYLIARRST